MYFIKKILCRPFPFDATQPLRTAVSFWGQTTQIPSSLSPKQNCDAKRAKKKRSTSGDNTHYHERLLGFFHKTKTFFPIKHFVVIHRSLKGVSAQPIPGYMVTAAAPPPFADKIICSVSTTPTINICSTQLRPTGTRRRLNVIRLCATKSGGRTLHAGFTTVAEAVWWNPRFWWIRSGWDRPGPSHS